MAESKAEVALATRLELTSFKLGGEEFAVDIAAVQEIVRMATITRIPRSPEFIEGVLNLRGQIVPVIDLRRRFGMPVAESTKGTRIIIVKVIGKTAGLIVDSVSEVLRIEASAVAPPPEMVARTGQSDFVSGIGQVGDRLLMLLDLNLLFSDQEVDDLAVA